MGRRNTKPEPPGIENKSQNRSLGLGQPERCSGWVLTQYSQRDGSSAQALPNQCTGWCCIDRLSRQQLPVKWIFLVSGYATYQDLGIQRTDETVRSLNAAASATAGDSFLWCRQSPIHRTIFQARWSDSRRAYRARQ